jgi:hypothetical protein
MDKDNVRTSGRERNRPREELAWERASERQWQIGRQETERDSDNLGAKEGV